MMYSVHIGSSFTLRVLCCQYPPRAPVRCAVLCTTCTPTETTHVRIPAAYFTCLIVYLDGECTREVRAQYCSPLYTVVMQMNKSSSPHTYRSFTVVLGYRTVGNAEARYHTVQSM